MSNGASFFHLIFDVGNTHVKVGIADKNSIAASYALPTEYHVTGDLWGVRIMDLVRHAGFKPEHAKAAVCSSVVPGLNAALKHACARFFNIELLFLPDDIAVPIEGLGQRGHELGADRLLGCFAARVLYPDPEYLICIDYGTATTFDCIKGSEYLGGVISPGVFSSADGLSGRAARLPRVNLNLDCEPGGQPASIMARTTQTHLTYGFVYGFAGLTEGIVRRMREETSGSAKVIATGGFATTLAPVTPCIDHVHPNLLLEGGRFLLQYHGISV